MTDRIINYWYQPSVWNLPRYLFFIVPALIALSFLYRSIVALRRACYKWGIKKINRLNVPVIIVGNITVGGAGKSPLVLYLSEYLVAQGWRPGIISRGYRGVYNHLPQMVSSDSDPFLVGDEPVMMAKKTTCPIVVCRDRVAAVKALLAQTDCNIIIGDDGLQHYALYRDIEIAVMGAERRSGNGYCLPVGPLREPIARLNEVDFVCVQGVDMRCIPGNIYQIVNHQAILDSEDFTHYPIHAVAGIGHPQPFFAMLRNQGLQITEHVFPDHHLFTPQDIDFGFESLVIMTEKDAVKCKHFADDRHWCLPISLEVDAKFLDNFQKKLNELSQLVGTESQKEVSLLPQGEKGKTLLDQMPTHLL